MRFLVALVCVYALQLRLSSFGLSSSSCFIHSCLVGLQPHACCKLLQGTPGSLGAVLCPCLQRVLKQMTTLSMVATKTLFLQPPSKHEQNQKPIPKLRATQRDTHGCARLNSMFREPKPRLSRFHRRKKPSPPPKVSPPFAARIAAKEASWPPLPRGTLPDPIQ